MRLNTNGSRRRGWRRAPTFATSHRALLCEELIRAVAMYTCNHGHGEASTALDLASQLEGGGLAPAPK
jgi:hypothetical protein